VCVASGAWSECSVPTPDSQPVDVAVGSDGSIWFTESAGRKLGRLVPATGVITEYDPSAQQPPLPCPVLGPWSAAVSGPDVWFTDPAGEQLMRFHLPLTRFYPFWTPTWPSSPQVVALSRVGDPWLTELTGNNVANYTWNSNGLWLEVSVPTPSSEPYGLALDGDDVWFTEKLGNKLGHVVGGTTSVGEFPLPTAASEPTDIVVDAAGCAWYAAPGADRIGRVCLHRTNLPLLKVTRLAP
jgi:virginiamycin B lyase